ncbi:MAG: YlxR family protein, partial [Dorea sp.]|nr:YlxR family protein [Dorea sp.]
GCQEMKNKKEMIRVIRTKEGEFLLDATGKKNGRGAYICPSKECFQKAVKNKGLERSFKQSIPAEVYEALEKEMGLIGTE